MAPRGPGMCEGFQVKRPKRSISMQARMSARRGERSPVRPVLIKSRNGFEHAEKRCINFLFGDEN